MPTTHLQHFRKRQIHYETMSLTVKRNIAIVTLTRPESANTTTAKMMDELLDVSIQCDTNPDVRAVLFLAEGPDLLRGRRFELFRQRQRRDHR